jgi:dUTP pyrophosphatase
VELLKKCRGFEPVSPEGLSKVAEMVETFESKGFYGRVFINESYKEPKRKTKKSAGSDIYYTGGMEVAIPPNDKVIIITNIKSYMQDGEVLLADVRSSQGLFSDLMICNTVGVIDSDYYNNKGNEGNIAIALRNLGKDIIIIHSGDAIAQLIFTPFLQPDNPSLEQDRLSGYGSTGQ